MNIQIKVILFRFIQNWILLTKSLESDCLVLGGKSKNRTEEYKQCDSHSTQQIHTKGKS